MFDATVKALTDNGVMVILNNHISNAGWCCSNEDGNGLWYNKDYPEDVWLETLENVTRKYQDNKMVIANDLRNELRDDKKNHKKALWGDLLPGSDWKRAAEKAGNAIHKINPDLLIMIEGINYANDLAVVRLAPAKLEVPNKMVYSAHVYGFQAFKFDSYEEMVIEYDFMFGFV